MSKYNENTSFALYVLYNGASEIVGYKDTAFEDGIFKNQHKKSCWRNNRIDNIMSCNGFSNHPELQGFGLMHSPTAHHLELYRATHGYAS